MKRCIPILLGSVFLLSTSCTVGPYIRYRGGVDTQLNALDADRDLFQAEFNLARIRLDESLTVVELYKALGGGWK
jgi:outer membrane protein TolC